MPLTLSLRNIDSCGEIAEGMIRELLHNKRENVLGKGIRNNDDGRKVAESAEGARWLQRGWVAFLGFLTPPCGTLHAVVRAFDVVLHSTMVQFEFPGNGSLFVAVFIA